MHLLTKQHCLLLHLHLQIHALLLQGACHSPSANFERPLVKTLATSSGIVHAELPLYQGGGAGAWVCHDASEMRWSWFCPFLWSPYKEFLESTKQPLKNASSQQ